MTSIHVTRRIESERLDLPELKPFIGKQVSITIEEAAVSATVDGWEALQNIAGKDLIDPDAYRQQRAFEVADQKAAADDPR